MTAQTFVQSPEAGSDSVSLSRTVASIAALSIGFRRSDGSPYKVVEDVDLDVHAGEILGLVGESGSGKSLTARSLIRLLPTNSTVGGTVTFEGEPILTMNDRALRKIRGGRAAMVFQDPMTSFNPVKTVGAQIAESLSLHSALRGQALRDRVVELLRQVGIVTPETKAWDYPSSYSGGMRQRAMIAMALANSPELLIADEPTTALDATVQDQVLDLLRTMNQELGTSIVLITHNIAVVASLCDRVAVMYSGRIVEEGPVEKVLGDPQHPYTWLLLKSVPHLGDPRERLASIEGTPPDPADPPEGCRFHPRCPFAIDRCRTEEPALADDGQGGKFRCFIGMRSIDRSVRDNV
ncbi:ABC transporter ATP-binding protein [Antarctobacter sp.]|uniref:ABC transporter ATP-binding protein n=1 Tax=Antarctobacter sp. TaxID=1872577 RepID=UPI003A8F7E3A